MNLWVYLLGNIITAATILLSAAFGVGKLTQILANQTEQLTQMRADMAGARADLAHHQDRDLQAFDAVQRSLLEIAMRLGDHPNA